MQGSVTIPRAPLATSSVVGRPTCAPLPAHVQSAATAVRRSRAHRWVLFSAVGDLLAALTAELIAFYVSFHTIVQGISQYRSPTVENYLGYFVIGPLSLVITLAWLGVYRRSLLLEFNRVRGLILKGCGIWTLGFLLVALTFRVEPPISRLYMGVAGLFMVVCLMSWRAWLGLRLTRPAQLAVLQQRAIMVGWGRDAAEFSAQLEARKHSPMRVTGWVGVDDSDPGPSDGHPPCVGSLADLESILHENGPDVVLLSDLSGPTARTVAVAELCEREMIQFSIIPSCFRIFTSCLRLDRIAGTPILGINGMPLDNSLNHFVKRCVDIIGGIVGLFLSAPAIAFFGLWVWIESRGAIFYRQVRMGENGRHFEILKIRSMKLNAEQEGGAQWAIKDDPRRLRIGAFLRSWNIDELPQFWNVVKGDMSLVGPRPERPELIANFKHQIPHYNARHHAKPGLTGWAAVNGLRGDTSLSQRIEADLWYLENWSLLLDFQIMLRTFLSRENAG
jgi:exopolysaccharide biosynthesis polyprenyl glycosylphosphotransferase